MSSSNPESAELIERTAELIERILVAVVLSFAGSWELSQYEHHVSWHALLVALIVARRVLK